MIVVDLMCEHEHRFEGWFACSDDIESQQARGLLTCAICGSHKMRRLPSAPHVQRSVASDASPLPSVEPDSELMEQGVSQPQAGETQHLLKLLVQKLQETATQSEDVGEDFPAEVRRIHYGDAEERPIRGLATSRDVAILLEEGISVLPVPLAKEDLH